MRYVLVAVAAMLAGGCGGTPVIQDAPPPMSQSTSIPKIGQIDDDREYDGTENIFIALLLLPPRAVGGLIDFTSTRIAFMQGDTPLQAAKMTTDQTSADNRRDGIYKLVGYEFAHRPPYTTRYEQMAQVDPDPTVRAAALRACSIAGDTHATSVLISGLTDKSEMVRLEAAKGLCNLPDANAVTVLLRVSASSDENRDVRIAATDALKYYRTQEVARGLVNSLNNRDFALAFQARRSLIYMTHKDFEFDQGKWLQYFAGPEKPLG
ncbi:MAG TPA: HEAT repeat domain-containing protein [Tepidisphaeraceae bacterium]|jgi:hypothetical protein|nr:HEAT repeat domain-containing protein [Tepidisphaeraceae bacterium]